MKPFVVEIQNTGIFRENISITGGVPEEPHPFIKIKSPIVKPNIVIDKFVVEDLSKYGDKEILRINLIDSALNLPKALSPSLTFPSTQYRIATYNYQFFYNSTKLQFLEIYPMTKLKIHFYPNGWDKKSFTEKIKKLFQL